MAAELEPRPPKLEENEDDKFPSEATYMEELVQELCDSAVDQKSQIQIPSGFLGPPRQPPILMEEPIVGIGTFHRNLGFVPPGNAVYASERRGSCVVVGPRNPRGRLIKPAIAAAAAAARVDGGRVRAYQEHNQNSNPVFPPRLTVKGTGVFLPRMQPAAMQERRNFVLTDFKHEENQNRMPVRKPGKKSKKKAAVGAAVKATSTEIELGLPKEWTY